MEEQECKICKKYTKGKYKHYRTWRILAIVFICISVSFAVLFFAKGTIENNIVIENADGSNENNVITGNGSTISGTVKKESNIGITVLVSVIVLTGGIICGCYIVSKNKSDK